MALLHRETTCEHGLLDEHDWYTSKPLQGEGDSALVGHFPGLCPGGTREEITIDYEEGAKARYKEYAKSAARHRDNRPWSWYELPRIPKAKFRHDARVTINAALGIKEVTDETN